MFIEIFIMLQCSMFIFFILGFYFKHEIFWALTLLQTYMLMYGAFFIQTRDLVFDTNINQIITQYTTHSISYLFYFNLLFFLLALVLGMLDLYDKYSNTNTYIKIGGNK